jgi:hypothetical protein
VPRRRTIVDGEWLRGGSDTKADLAAFKREIADPLLDAGVEPSDRSKTELGGDCPQ